EQVGAEHLERRLVGRGAGPDHHVDRREVAPDVAPPQLAQSALQTIAGHRGPAVARDDQSQARLALLAGGPSDVEVCPLAAPAAPKDPLDVGPPANPARAPEALVAGQTRACFEPTDTV